MKVNKKLRNDLEVIENLQRISGYKRNKNSREKNPRKIFLQKISTHDNGNPIKIQLLKTNIDNFDNNFFNTNSTLLNSNNNNIPYSKNDKKYYYPRNDKYETKYQDKNYSKDKIKDTQDYNKNNKNRVIEESPVVNRIYKYSTHKILNQNPILKTPDINGNNINEYIYDNGNDNGIKTQNINVHKIRHVLSKNLAFNQKKHSNITKKKKKLKIKNKKIQKKIIIK